MFFVEVLIMKVCVIGVGYIGLPTACILNKKGFHVVGVDINKEYINMIKSGKFSSEEKLLAQLVNSCLANKSFSLKTSPENADVFLLCTPTPLDSNMKPDLSYLTDGLNSILPFIKEGNLIIVESTIPPSTITDLIQPILESRGLKVGVDVFLGHCPERVIPGNIVHELIHNDRIIGGCTEKCGEVIGNFYSKFVEGEVFITSSHVAEMVKLVENIYRDVNIALVNEIALICNFLSIDLYEVINLANKHPRVQLLNPGIGVGGHCLPVDSYFLIDKVPDLSKLIQISRSINNDIPPLIADKLERLIRSLNLSNIGIWGITYKGNTDDIRNSPSLKIGQILLEKGFNIKLYDPLVKSINSNYHKYASILGSDILLLLVNHNDFVEEDYNMITKLMRTPVIFDATNIIDGSTLSKEVILYNLANI